MKSLKSLLPLHRKNHKNSMMNCATTSATKMETVALPEGASETQLMDEQMVREILDMLPVRAYGYPWHLIYSSSKHGFSLGTLYRRMAARTKRVKGQHSPALLVIKSMESESVFGAIVNSDLLLDPRGYTGTGDSCLLFRFCDSENGCKFLQPFKWTMRNDYFVYAQPEFLSIGAGDEGYGLWLDDALNRGVSQRCATFGNDPLAGDGTEHFLIKAVEVFCFGDL